MTDRRTVVSRIWLACLLVGLTMGLSLATLNQPPTARAAETAFPASGLQIVQSSKDMLVVDLDVPAYELQAVAVAQEQFQRIAIEGAAALALPGKPELPKFSALLGIPPQGRVSVRVLEDLVETMPGPYRLLPAAGPAPLTGDLQPGTTQRLPDRAAYANAEFYPAEVARVVEIAWLRDQRLARVEIYPFNMWRPRARCAGTVTYASKSNSKGPVQPIGWRPPPQPLARSSSCCTTRSSTTTSPVSGDWKPPRRRSLHAPPLPRRATKSSSIAMVCIA